MQQANFTNRLQGAAKNLALAVLLSWATLLHTPAASAQPQNVDGASAQEFVLAVLGDSLSAGYQLPEEASFPAVLQKRLRAAGHRVRVINASVSGDTSTGGLARLDWALGDKVDGVIVELGANDMLRGIEPAQTRKALDAIISRIKAKGAKVLLAGMLAAPGMGKIYTEQFNAIYPDLARKHAIPLIPFFLEGVAARKELNLGDGMHPNAKGVETMVSNAMPKVLTLIAPKTSAR